MTSPSATRILVAPDKFRGTLTATAAADAIIRGAHDAAEAGAFTLLCRAMPLADGGEGTVEALGGANRHTTVTGPLGTPVPAAWRLDGSRAVIEMAAASGLLLAGGAGANDPIAATTRGTGELILAATDAGARDILIGLGGSATTDGGAGALEVLAPAGGPRVLPPGVTLTVCADVQTLFLDAAAEFGPQKGATPGDVAALHRRLEHLRAEFVARFGVDVASFPHAGAAGGLAGGLAAIGARLVPGFDAVADALDFDAALGAADLVITGEGSVDHTSLDGKVVGGVCARARRAGVPVLVVCGSAAADVALPAGASLVSLAGRYGLAAAMAEPARCLEEIVAAALPGLVAAIGRRESPSR